MLPAAGSWDGSATPPLPMFVTVPASRKAPRPAPWRFKVWHPDLGWVASLPALAAGQFEALQSVNDWLVATDGRPVAAAPVRFRSAEIFGAEKLLEELAGSALFGPGRLSLQRLGALRLPPPLALVRVSDGPDVLVVENSDPFWVCRDVLAETAGPVGRVGFGSGKAFVATVAALGNELEPVRRVFYWGDLNPAGVDIASDAAAMSAACGLPVLEPAGPLWAAMAALPASSAGRYDWSERGAGWLGEGLWAASKLVRAAGGRVAQERVAPAVVAAAVAALSDGSAVL